MKSTKIYCDPLVISNVEKHLIEHGVDRMMINRIKDIVYYDSPMRALDSYKQHVEFGMAVMKAFYLGCEYNPSLIKNTKPVQGAPDEKNI